MMPNLNIYPVPFDVLYSTAFGGFRGSVTHSKLSGETTYEHHQDEHRIFVTLEGRTGATIAEVDHQPTIKRPDRPGVVTIVPAGIKRRVLLRDLDFLILDMTISDSFLQLCAEEDSDRARISLPFVQNVRNDWLMRAAQAFREAGAAGASALQMQTLAFAMVKHLARSTGRVSEGRGLDPVALSRVLQLMQDRIAEDLTLTDLASESGLGISAFGRAFSKSLGTTPYRFFAALRMQRARELLAQTRRPLAEIAGETGYSDQAHFTTAFTRHAGLSPGKWRADLGSVPSFMPISRKTSARDVA